MNREKHHLLALIAALIVLSLGIGLVGCNTEEEPGEKHLAPESVDYRARIDFAVVGDSLAPPEATVSVNYIHSEMFTLHEWEGIASGCFGSEPSSSPTIYYDQFDWAPLRDARVTLNSIVLDFQENQSILPDSSFYGGFAKFDLPDVPGFNPQPGDTTHLRVQVEGYDMTYQDTYEPVTLSPIIPLGLPEEMAVYSPGDTIVITSSADISVRITARLFEDSTLTIQQGYAWFSSEEPVAELPIWQGYSEGTIYLVCTQEGPFGRNYIHRRTYTIQ